MEGTGGKTIRAEGVLISDYIKRIEESRKTNETKQETTDSEMSDEMKDWLGDDSGFIPPQFHKGVNNLVTEYKGSKIPGKKITEAIVEYSKSSNADISLDIIKDTDEYKDLSETQKNDFDYNFKKSIGADVSNLEKPKTIGELNSKKKELKEEVRLRKRFSDKSDNDLVNILDDLNSKDESDLSDKEVRDLELIPLEISRRESAEGLSKFTDTQLSKMISDIDNIISDKRDANSTSKVSEKTKLRDKIKTLQQGIKKGLHLAANDIKTRQKNLKAYADNVLSDYNLSDAKRSVIDNMIINVSKKNPLLALNKIDKIAEEYKEKSRKRTIQEIKTFLSKRSNFEEKKGKRRVLKIPSDVYELIKKIKADNNIDEMSLENAKAFLDMVKGIRQEGIDKQNKIKRIKNAQSRKNRADSFFAYNTVTPEVVNGKEALIEALSDRDNVAIINGQLISSKTVLDDSTKEQSDRESEISGIDDLYEFLDDNPDMDFENIPVYKTRNKEDVLKDARYKSRTILGITKTFAKSFYTAKANIQSMLVGLSKGSKARRLQMEKLEDSINTGEHDFHEGVFSVQQQVRKDITNIFAEARKNRPMEKYIKYVGKTDYTGRRLSSSAKIEAKKDYDTPISNQHIIDWYNQSKTDGGPEKLKSAGVDLDIVTEYINRPENIDLKNYADYLIDFYNQNESSKSDNSKHFGIKDRYEYLYEELTGKKFPKGIYYPRFVQSPMDIIEGFDVMDDSGNFNFMKPMAGSLNERVDNNNRVRLDIGAFDKQMAYIEQMERVKAFKSTGELAGEIFNRHSVPEMIKLSSEQEFIDLKDQLALIITGKNPRTAGVKTEQVDNIINAIVGLQTAAALTFKPASIPLQATSALHWSAAKGVSPVELVSGGIIRNKEELNVLYNIITSNYIKERVGGGSFDIELNSFKKGLDSGVLLGKPVSQILEHGMSIGMLPITTGDAIGVLAGGIPYTIARYRQNIDKGMSPEDAYDAAYRDFTRESEHVQQSTRASQTSHFKRNKTGRLFSIYRSAQTAANNKAFNSFRLLASKSDLSPEEKKHHVYNALYYTGVSNVFNALKLAFIESAYAYFMDSEDDDKKQQAQYKAYRLTKDNLQAKFDGMGMNGVLLNQSLNVLTGEDWKNGIPMAEGLKDITTTGGGLMRWALTAKSWDELSDSEKRNINAGSPLQSLDKQNENFKKLLKGDKTITNFILNRTGDDEESKFKEKEDILWKKLNNIPIDEPTNQGKNLTGKLSGKLN